ncbi:MAG: U32 family peptidase [Halomonas sp.]|uniref:U32 family peptidase n=1 Tax=Halomonas sp. TaxID=1486246 RepID=UPI002ACDCD0F|nr:U32 family peptidase [Halomonas sp.]MDZ7854530.1 U32 family peptidase [Halomonas sp.]
MKIVAPISRVDEAETLAGRAPMSSIAASSPGSGGTVSAWPMPTVVPPANLTSFDELDEAIRLTHAGSASLSLVMNAQQYRGDQVEAAMTLAERFLQLGGNALIVSDLGLVAALSDALPGVRLHVSSVATCRNTEAAAFCRELGARRLILPRDVTLAEAAHIAAAEPEMEIEAFILNDGCVYEEGSCHTLHLPAHMGGPICLDSYRYTYRRRDGRSIGPGAQAALKANEAEYRKWLWHRFSCGFTITQEGMPYGPHGLCALPRLLAGDITAVKIAGREGPRRASWPAPAWSTGSWTRPVPAGPTPRSATWRATCGRRSRSAGPASCAITRKSPE